MGSPAARNQIPGDGTLREFAQLDWEFVRPETRIESSKLTRMAGVWGILTVSGYGEFGGRSATGVVAQLLRIPEQLRMREYTDATFGGSRTLIPPTFRSRPSRKPILCTLVNHLGVPLSSTLGHY